MRDSGFQGILRNDHHVPPPMTGRDVLCMSACYLLVAAIAAMVLAPEASAAFIIRALTAVFGTGL